MSASVVIPMKVQILSIGGDAVDRDRTSALMKVLKPVSSKEIETLDGATALLDDDFESLGFERSSPVLIRLLGKTQIDALRWLGPKGRVATDAAILGIVEAILCVSGEAPRAMTALPTAFVAAFAVRKVVFDATGTAMMIGAQDEVRSMASGLARLGFKKIIVVDADDKKATDMVHVLKRRLLNIDISALSHTLLTQAPNDSSVAVNLAGVEDSSLIEDTSYLNFLKKNGVWIDWSSATTELGHSEEIRSSSAQVIPSEVIRAWREVGLLMGYSEIWGPTGQKPETLALEIEKAWLPTLKLVPKTDSP